MFEIYLLIDENGDYVVAKDTDGLGDAYDQEIGGDSSVAKRVVKVTVAASLPKTAELACSVPDEPEIAKVVA